MELYERYLLPHLINCVCGTKEIERQRGLVVTKAKGRVLEIGMGSGLNLKHYDKNQVEHLWGLEPSEGMRKKAQSNICLLYTSPSPRDLSTSRMPSSA